MKDGDIVKINFSASRHHGLLAKVIPIPMYMYGVIRTDSVMVKIPKMGTMIWRESDLIPVDASTLNDAQIKLFEEGCD